MYRLIAVAVLVCFPLTGFSANDYWDSDQNSISFRAADGFRVHRLNIDKLRGHLNSPGPNTTTDKSVELPMPDGSIAEFSLKPTRTMDDALAAKYPHIKTYRLIGKNGQASGVMDMTGHGLHAMLNRHGERVMIDPETSGSSQYRVRKSIDPRGNGFSCATEMSGRVQARADASPLSSRPPNGLKQYRLVVSATQEYTAVSGGTVELALSAIVTAISRVNEIYQRDLGIKLLLIAATESVIYTANDPFSNYNATALLQENQQLLNTVIGSANYDIGHVFSTGGGGYALVGGACVSGSKARGVTGIVNPVGDPFYIDYVAHEMGHQFGANHTFNGSSGSCGSENRKQSTAYEPGSGSTIMAYAGICTGENLQSNSDAMFHAGSIEEIGNFETQRVSCGAWVDAASNSSSPTANAGPDRVIPVGTPFKLSGTGTDTESAVLNYQWDQMDRGTATSATTFGQDLLDNPLMRSFLPEAEGSRSFPKLSTLVSGQNDRAQKLPATAREMNFRLVVSDGLGGIASDDVRIQVDNTSGPFTVTGPVSSPLQTEADVSWDQAGTDLSPVNCDTVDINLLTFSTDKSTYCRYELAHQTANDGDETVQLEDKSADHARFEVSCSNNAFYNISNQDLSISGNGVYGVDCVAIDVNSHAILPQFSSAQGVRVPANIPGALPAVLTDAQTDYRVYYQFNAVAGSYTFNLGWSGSSDLAMTLFDEQGQTVDASGSGSSNSEAFTVDLTAASYYLLISGNEANVDFNLRVLFNQLANNVVPEPIISQSGGGAGLISLASLIFLLLVQAASAVKVLIINTFNRP